MPDTVLYEPLEKIAGGAQGQREAERKRTSFYLHSGQLHASDEPCSITTILGSCVAVCLWDSAHGVGGATHYLLPHRVSGAHTSVRFGNVAIEQLIGTLLGMGGVRSHLRAKVFGGACIFSGFKKLEDQLGTKNVEVALQKLEEEGIPLLTHDTGGPQGRKLIFNTDSGDAWVKLL